MAQQGQTAADQVEPTLANDAPPGTPKSPDQNQGNEKPEPVKPSKLTVDQYLFFSRKRNDSKTGKRIQVLDSGIGELVRSLYRTKILSFEEWENTVKTLLEKQVR
jgi:hypothetical protein